MPMTLHCDIVSTTNSMFSGLITSIVVSGELGDLGIQYGHAPLLTSLIPGPIRVISADDQQEQLFYVSGGFLEVQNNVVTVLADTVVRADSLDEAAAQQAQDNARQLITNQAGEFDYSKAALQLAEAAAQLRVIQKMRKQTR